MKESSMTKRDEVLRALFKYNCNLESDEVLSKFKSFWMKSYNHFNIILLLGSVSNEEDGFSYESICEQYPHKLASRTTILSILNEGYENNFFHKRLDTKDHRKHNYKLVADAKKNVIAWLDNHPVSKFNKN